MVLETEYLPQYSTSYFRALAWKFSKAKKNGKQFNIRTFLALFGVDPTITSILRNKIKMDLTPESESCHLLSTLLFPKTYNTEDVLSALC